ncbi:MAG: four helix bundle protein [Vicinamibacterales bacterium]|nr:four helix bundle protein [Vicinamibacterales bacterium]MDP7691140.1 four helix bundle protein [Vicinamibacterales bacterium]HJN45317.1 four helix bundle protein [Vicinamibacterales bacterium]|tara:strand:- start:328 stop:717 length:390 start_codon:yes stop_codon:yes gene_type:complete
MHMAPAETFQDLVVWQKSHQFVLQLYRHSADFPKSEIFGLTQQLRRAAVSIPANIAEGFKRRGRTDKARFMNIAQGSLEETRYYLILAKDLGFLDTRKLLADLEEVGRILGAYRRTLRSPASRLLPPAS